MKLMRTTVVNTNLISPSNSTQGAKWSGIGLFAGLLGILTGCIAPGPPPPDQRADYSAQPPPRADYAPPPSREAPLRPPPGEYVPAPTVVETPPTGTVVPDNATVSQDEYVYYPNYEIYYNPHRRVYTYREGGAWLTAPEPPHIGIDVLLGAPSVHLNFHDAPRFHHEAVIRQYPRHWAPPGQPRREHFEGGVGRP